MTNRADAHPNFGARFVMLLSATGTVLLILFGLRLSESLTDRIHEARVQVAHDFRYLQQQSHTLSRMLVQSSPVQRGAHFKHIGLLDNYLTPSARELNIDLIMVHDVQGDLLYQNRESTTNLPVLAPEILRKALDGQSFSRIERSQTGFQLISTSPIRHATDNTRITGALTLGYHLNDAFFEDLREMTGTEVLLSHSQGVIASSFEGLAPSKILAEPHLLDIASTRYDLSPIPLKQAHDSTLKMVVAVDNEQVRSTLYWVMLVIPLLFVLFWRERTITEQRRAKTMEGAVAEVQAQISDAEQAASVSKRARVTAQEELESTQHLLMRAQRLSITGEQLSSVSADIHSSIESILQIQKEQRSQTTLGLQIMSRLGLGGDDARNLEGALRDLENGIYENQLVGRRIWELVTAIMSQNTTVRTVGHDIEIIPIINQVLTIFRGRTKAHKVTTDFLDPPTFSGRAAEIGQVLTNLLSNAIDAVDERAESERRHGRSFEGRIHIHVSLAVREDEHGLRVVITDNGTGFAQEELEHLFEAFFTHKPAGSGLGLGLTISQRIIDEHRGKLRASRDPALGGARFDVWIPTSWQEPEIA